VSERKLILLKLPSDSLPGFKQYMARTTHGKEQAEKDTNERSKEMISLMGMVEKEQKENEDRQSDTIIPSHTSTSQFAPMIPRFAQDVDSRMRSAQPKEPELQAGSRICELPHAYNGKPAMGCALCVVTLPVIRQQSM